MSKMTDLIRRHHQSVMESLDRFIIELDRASSAELRTALIQFLNSELLPHMLREERHLYPRLDEIVAKHGWPTETMSIDHEFIERSIKRIEASTRKLESARGEELHSEEAGFRDLVLGLVAVLKLHVEKEERAYLPLLDDHIPEAERVELLKRIHEDTTKTKNSNEPTGVLDVRELPPAQRHALIFETFDGLNPGCAFTLVNDHDPKPLYYQFLHERKNLFQWEYLDRGPEVWRVKITRQEPEKGGEVTT